jgi:hypothetical protein
VDDKHTVYQLAELYHRHRVLIVQLELDIISMPVGPEMIPLFVHIEKGDPLADVARSRALCCGSGYCVLQGSCYILDWLLRFFLL